MARPSSSASDDRDSDDLDRLPGHLFKYCGVAEERMEWLQRLIEREEIYFPSPALFNDPLDCRIPPSYKSSQLKIEQYWRDYLRRNPHPGVDRKARVKELVKQARTAEGRAHQTEVFFNSVNSNGVLSLSAASKSMLMWSYYAEGHKGICVRLRTTPENLVRVPEEMFPLEVHYTTSFPEPVFYEDHPRQLLRKVFGTKSQEWEHEREWRLVLVRQTGYLRLPTGFVDGIVLGMRTEADVVELVRSWIAGRDIELMRIQNREGTFKLESVSV